MLALYICYFLLNVDSVVIVFVLKETWMINSIFSLLFKKYTFKFGEALKYS